MSFAGKSNPRPLAVVLAVLCSFAAGLALPATAAARYASIVIDPASGQVLHEVNADTRNYPASLTKMMTLYLAFQGLERGKLRPGQRLRVSRRAAGMPASKLGLKPGQRIKLEDAIVALVVKSANDAAVVIAEAIGGTERGFARVMNKKAKALGMRRTNFRNASGLPNRRQLSTARDMAKLVQALINDFPQYYHYFSNRKFSYSGRTYKNYNKLLTDYAGADGLKTGYTRASGYNLAASAVRNGRRLIAVVFGGRSAKSRNRHVAKLFNKGFANPLIVRGKPAPQPPAKPSDILTVKLAPVAPTPTRKPTVARGAKPDKGPPVPSRKPKLLATAETAASTPTAPGDGQGDVAAIGQPISLLPPQAEGRHHVLPDAPDGSDQVADAIRRFAADDSWGVQVGAFHNPSPAKRAATLVAQRFPKLLGETQIVTPHIESQTGRIYRARLIGMSKDAARDACRKLRSARVDCLVVQSSTKVEVALNKTTGG